MPTQDPALGPGPASSSVSQPVGGRVLNEIPVPNRINSITTALYNGAQNDMYGDITGPAPSVGTPEEENHHQSWPANDEQVSDSGRDSIGMPDQPRHIDDATLAPEGDDLEEARQSAAVGEDDSNRALLSSNYTCVEKTVLIIGVLSLIVVPGLVLGVVTRQVQWGIALFGAIATVVGVILGICRHKSRG